MAAYDIEPCGAIIPKNWFWFVCDSKHGAIDGAVAVVYLNYSEYFRQYKT